MNFVGSVDRVLLGAGNHIYVPGPDGYDPEGLLGTLPAIAQGLIGIATGEYLLRTAKPDRLRPLAIAGGGDARRRDCLGLRLPGREGHMVEHFRARHVGIALAAAAAFLSYPV